MTNHHISVVSVPVTDVDRSKAFYMDVLGFELVMDNTMADGTLRWVMLRPSAGGTAITLVTWFERMPAGSLQGTVLAVPDLDAAITALTAHQVEFTPPESSPWGRWVTIHDLDGNSWVIQQNAPAPA